MDDAGAPIVFSRPAPCRWTCARCGWMSETFPSYEALRAAVEDQIHTTRTNDLTLDCSYDDTTRGVDYMGDGFSGPIPFMPRETIYGLQTGPYEWLPRGGVQPYDGGRVDTPASLTMCTDAVNAEDSSILRPRAAVAWRRAADRARHYREWLDKRQQRLDAEAAAAAPVAKVSWWRRRLRALGDWLKNR